MQYTQFVKHVKRNGWSIPELRCDVRPTNELLHFIETVGANYEAFVIRYLTIYQDEACAECATSRPV